MNLNDLVFFGIIDTVYDSWQKLGKTALAVFTSFPYL
jgi:hypothetical protein